METHDNPIIEYTPIPFEDGAYWRNGTDVLLYLAAHPAERERLMKHAWQCARGGPQVFQIGHTLLGKWKVHIHSHGNDYDFLYTIQTVLLFNAYYWLEIPGLESKISF